MNDALCVRLRTGRDRSWSTCDASVLGACDERAVDAGTAAGTRAESWPCTVGEASDDVGDLEVSVSDIDEILERLRGLIGDQDPNHMIAFVHFGPPISKARARWNQKTRRFYTPGQSHTAEESLSSRFREALAGRPPFLGPMAIVAIFFRQNRQRIDADNLMKLVMDAATKARVWRDDCQVAAQAALMELDVSKPRTVIALCPYWSTLDRTPLTVICQRCGKEFERPEWYLRQNKRRGRAAFCSIKCAKPVGLTQAHCPRCEHDFTRRTPGQRFCSVKCAQQQRWVRLPNGEQRPPAVCEKCGQKVSRREYKQCRACRGYGRPIKAVTALREEGRLL